MEIEHKTFFKPPRVTEKVRRRRKRESRTKRLRENKQAVRDRERKITRRGCRFPKCGCWRRGLHNEVSHLRHQGMGGNPKEDRNAVELLINVCNWRHREGRIAIDKGTLDCRPLTDAGTNGPVAWWVDAETLADLSLQERGVLIAAAPINGWVILAYEIAPGELGHLEPDQEAALEWLAQMEV